MQYSLQLSSAELTIAVNSSLWPTGAEVNQESSSVSHYIKKQFHCWGGVRVLVHNWVWFVFKWRPLVHLDLLVCRHWDATHRPCLQFNSQHTTHTTLFTSQQVLVASAVTSGGLPTGHSTTVQPWIIGCTISRNLYLTPAMYPVELYLTLELNPGNS
jgi:hypothetical protein